jgi:hypothetical protein
MDHRHNDKRQGAIVWSALALVGAAALAFVIVKKIARGEDVLDTDALLAAADEAANNLDAILMAESAIAS